MSTWFDDTFKAKCPCCTKIFLAKDLDQEEHPFRYPKMAGLKETILVCDNCQACIEIDSEFVWRECET